jgi:hypothetical protein
LLTSSKGLLDPPLSRRDFLEPGVVDDHAITDEKAVSASVLGSASKGSRRSLALPFHSLLPSLIYRVRRVCSPLKWQTIPLTKGRNTTGQKSMGDYAKVVIRLMRWSGGRLSVVW